MIDHPFGWQSLLPPLIAIFLAIVTRRVMLSLLLGIFVGALILTNWDPMGAVTTMCNDHLLKKLLDSGTLHIFFFTMLMGAMVGMINRSGGMRGLVNVVTPFASNRKRGQFVTWLLGGFVFFDDYANTMLLGNTMRPLTDRLKISREKLAYLVDSTAAPISGLALISTWVATELDYVRAGVVQLPGIEEAEATATATTLFIQSIPYRFYVLWALLFVPIVALLGRDFGPMWKAEKRAAEGLRENGTELDESNLHHDPTAPESETKSRWFNAVIPILVTVFGVVAFLYISGKGEVDDDAGLMEIFGNADSYSALLWGALSGAMCAYIMILPQRVIPAAELSRAAGNGAMLMVPALGILWLAQVMSTMTGNGDSDSSAIEKANSLAQVNAADAQILEQIADEPAPSIVEAMTSLVESDYASYLKAAEAATPEKQAELWNGFSDRAQSRLSFLADRDAFAKKLSGFGWDEARLAGLSSTFEVSESSALTFEAYSASDGETNEGVDDDSSSQSISFPCLSDPYVGSNQRLYTGDFLSAQLEKISKGEGPYPDSQVMIFLKDNFVKLLPTLVFVLAGIVAFSTGTSWGTMGIMVPLVIPLAYSQLAIGGQVSMDSPIFLCCLGSVLAGAIFGDHCSPISDTTVLSSQASGCDHVAHVRTQLPYALLVGFVAIALGTLPIGYGINVWLMLPAGVVLLFVFLFLFGKRVNVS